MALYGMMQYSMTVCYNTIYEFIILTNWLGVNTNMHTTIVRNKNTVRAISEETNTDDCVIVMV